MTAPLAGCGAGCTSATEAATALPAGVTVAVTQLRSDVADRQVEVQVHNGSDEAIEIGAVSLDDPRFAAPATRVVDRTSTLAPGRTVNVRVQLADVVCDGTATPGATVTFAYTQGDRAGTASAAAGEVFPFLDALHRRECVAARTAAAADVTWSAFTPSDAGAPASLELSIVPRSGAAAAVLLADVRETNLLTFDGVAGGILPLDVTVGGDDQTARTIALPLRPARCDPHAVQEDKRGTVFTLDVVVGGEPGQFTLAADAALRGRILAWVADWCGYG